MNADLTYKPELNAPSEEAPRTNGYYNTAAIKRHAMKVSIETRSGKFSRVSEQFTNEVEASIEAFLRKMRAPVLSHTNLEVDCTEDFLTGAGKKRLVEAFNLWVAGEIHRKSKDVRTGKTL